MIIFTCKLLVMSLRYLLLHGHPNSARIVQKPSTPGMFRELCQATADSTKSFNFMKEDHSCQRIPTNDSSSTEKHQRDKAANNITFVISMGRTNHSDVKDGVQRVCDVTQEDAHTEDLNEDDHSINITSHQACEEGNLAMVKYILSNNLEDINSRGKKRRTPVMIAVLNKASAIFDYLERQRCDLTAVDDSNNTILHLACSNCDYFLVRTLIAKYKFHVDSRGWKGRTPVMFAAYFGCTDMMGALQRKGGDMYAVDNDNNNLLHVVCMNGNVGTLKRVLFKRVSPIDAKNHKGRTAAMIAAERGFTDAVDLLRLNGCNMMVVDEDDNNVLHIACLSGKINEVRYLVRLGIFTGREENKNGHTPLQIAQLGNHTEMVDLLNGV